MTTPDKPADAPLALDALAVPARARASNYPDPFAVRVADRVKRPLGNAFGLTNFGVNLTTLPPGCESALLHRHEKQDEFIYILDGEAVLVTDKGDVTLRAGMCAGFPAGGIAHQLVNRSAAPVTYLEIGDRTAGDTVDYPVDDLRAVMGADGAWIFTHKDGTPW